MPVDGGLDDVCRHLAYLLVWHRDPWMWPTWNWLWRKMLWHLDTLAPMDNGKCNIDIYLKAKEKNKKTKTKMNKNLKLITSQANAHTHINVHTPHQTLYSIQTADGSSDGNKSKRFNELSLRERKIFLMCWLLIQSQTNFRMFSQPKRKMKWKEVKKGKTAFFFIHRKRFEVQSSRNCMHIISIN